MIDSFPVLILNRKRKKDERQIINKKEIRGLKLTSMN